MHIEFVGKSFEHLGGMYEAKHYSKRDGKCYRAFGSTHMQAFSNLLAVILA